jgi:cardiolipin synthase
VEQIRLSQPGQASAYWQENQASIRFSLVGRDVYTHAAWTPPVPAGGVETAAAYTLSVLGLDRADQARGRRLAHETTPLRVHGPEAWHQLQQRLLEELTPTEPGHGLLLLVQQRETVLFRDSDGRIESVWLEHLPASLSIQRVLDNEAYSNRILELVARQAQATGTRERRLVYATGTDPSFVLIDTARRQTIFLSHATDPEVRGLLSLTPDLPVHLIRSLIIRSSLLALIKNPVTTLCRGVIWFGGTGLALIPLPSAPLPSLSTASTEPPMDLAAWEADLDRMFPRSRSRGSVQFYAGGESFFPALIEAIRESTNRIDFQVYIFDNDDYAIRIADLLREKSATVEVRVLLDEFGTFTSCLSLPQSSLPPGFRPPTSIQRYLSRGSKVRVRSTTNPWLTVNHKKCFIFDRERALLGGMNIGREYRYEWRDLMCEITGPVVARLQHDFERDWAHAGLFGDLAYALSSLFTTAAAHPEMGPNIDVRILYTRTGRPEIHRAQIEAIRRTRRYIYIENPYFADETFFRELVAARRRGVDVRIILPAENDSGIMSASNVVTANAMIREGIRVFAYPGMTHVKAGIYDGWACVGSANFDKISLRVSQELNIAFSDPETVERLNRQLFEPDFARSREILEPLPVGWTDYLIEFFANEM